MVLQKNIHLHMNRFLTLIFLIYGNLFTASSVKSSNILGADITYKHVSGYKWEITLQVYRNCRGDSFQLTFNDVQIACNNLNIQQPLYLKRESIKDITVINSYASMPCDPLNAKTKNTGIEKHTFRGILDLDSSRLDTFKNCGELYIFFEKCCRDTAISTGDFGRNKFNTYASIAISTGLFNSSVQFEADPIVYLCKNVPSRLSAGVSDKIDFDSLVFSLSTPLPGRNAPSINYDSGFSKEVPLSVYFPANRKPPFNNPMANPPVGFFLDHDIGNYIFTPVRSEEMGVYVIQVDEYRKDSSGIVKKVGSTRRDIMAIVQDCDTNHAPQIQISGKTFTELSICNQDSIKICFDISTSDEPADNLYPKDSVFLRPLYLPSGASFNYNNTQSIKQSGKFCMQFSDSFIQGPNKYKPLSVVFEARDNQSPLNAVALKTISFGLIKEQTAKSLIQGYIQEDYNRNCKADSGERMLSQLRISFSNNTHTNTDLNGKFKNCLNIGEYRARPFPSPWFIDCGDTVLNTKRDSVYSIEFFRSIEYGVSGVVYKNSYCDSPLHKREIAENVMVIAKPGNYVATTDSEGRYVLKLPLGKTYRITVGNNQTYTVNPKCDSFHLVQVLNNSSYHENNFGIEKIPDIGLSLISESDGPELVMNQVKRVLLRLTNSGEDITSVFRTHFLYDSRLKIDTSHSILKIIEPGHAIIRTQLGASEIKEFSFAFMVDSNDYQFDDLIYFQTYFDSVDQKQNLLTHNDTSLNAFKITKKTNSNQIKTYNDSLITPVNPWIYYHLEFQNTEQKEVNEVIIKDTLPDGLDYSSLEVIETKPKGRWILDHNKIWFFFTDTFFSDRLSDSINSKGSVQFRIRAQDTIRSKRELINSASVQFGFYPEKQLIKSKSTFHTPLKMERLNSDSFCSLDQIRVQYCSFYKIWDKNHTYILEISENGGSFLNPRTLYEWKTDSGCGIRYIIIPDSIETGKYRLRLRSSEKNAVGFEDSYSQMIFIESLLPDTLMLSATELCQGEFIHIQSTKQRSNQKLYINNSLFDSSGSNPTWSLNHLEGTNQIYLMTGESATCFRSSDTQTLVIHPRPDVKWSSDSNFCFDDHLLHLTNETESDQIQGGLHYILNINNHYSHDLDNSFQDTSLRFDHSGNYQIILIAETNRGCKDSLLRTITIYENPKAVIGKIPLEICDKKDGISFLDRSTYPDFEKGQRQWNFGDGTISDQVEGTHIWQVGTYQIQLIAKSENGCLDTARQKLTILPSPQAEFFVDNDTQCFRDHLFQFDVTNILDSNSLIQIEWNFGDGEYSYDKNPEHRFQNSGQYKVNVILKNQVGCSDTSFKEIQVYPSPVASTLDSLYSVCQWDEGFQINFEGKAPTGTYLIWHTGTGDSLFSDTFRFVYKDTGTFHLIHALSLGLCHDTSNTIIHVSPSPKINSISGENVCLDDTTRIVYSLGTKYPGTSLLFSWPDGSTDNYSDPEKTMIQKYFSSAGSYSFSLQAFLPNGCQDSMGTNCDVFWKSRPDFRYEHNRSGEYIFISNGNDSVQVQKWIIQEKGITNEFSEDPLRYKFKIPGKYMITLMETSVEGCISEISKEIPVVFGNMFRIPSLLEYSTVESFELSNYDLLKSLKMTIWDLSGRKIFESTNPITIFSGFRPAAGLYIYDLVATDLENMQHKHSGSIRIFKSD